MMTGASYWPKKLDDFLKQEGKRRKYMIEQYLVCGENGLNLGENEGDGWIGIDVCFHGEYRTGQQ